MTLGYRRRSVLLAALLALAPPWLAGCDPQRIDELEEGVATEADVRARFGEPVAIYPDTDGARTLEYPRQPAGHRNYMITIGADGRMSALRQVLKPEEFAKVRVGLDKAQVRRLLGRPAATQVYPFKQQEVWDWRYLEGTDSRLFSVGFDTNGLVVETGSRADPQAQGGG